MHTTPYNVKYDSLPTSHLSLPPTLWGTLVPRTSWVAPSVHGPTVYRPLSIPDINLVITLIIRYFKG